MSDRELYGKVAVVTGVSRRAGVGAAIARELAHAGAKLFVTFFRKCDQKQTWGLKPREPEMLMEELSAFSEVNGLELDLTLM